MSLDKALAVKHNVIMNRKTINERAKIISCLVEGMSIRSTCRITGASKNTVVKLLVQVGRACDRYQYDELRNLTCEKIQVDEIWSFCGMKEKNVPADKINQRGFGDVWTWTAIDAKTKLVPCWMVGSRDADYARVFMEDLASRMDSRIQLTSDGHKAYVEAVENAFGGDIDFSQLVKIYGEAPEGVKKYSTDTCIGTKKHKVSGNPDINGVSTSYVERQNLHMRMSMRRFTRKTNGFSKKIENLECAVALHFMHYNFARIHTSLRVTPAMEAGIADHVWTIEEIAALIPEAEPKKRRGYKKKLPI